MPHQSKPLIMLLAAVLAAAGCAGIQSFKTNQFETRSWNLLRAIRWGDYDSAVACMAPGAKAPDPKIFEAVKVSDYDTGPLRMSADGMRITQPATFRYYRTDTYRERSTAVEMVWRYDPEAKNWFLESGFPAF